MALRDHQEQTKVTFIYLREATLEVTVTSKCMASITRAPRNIALIPFNLRSYCADYSLIHSEYHSLPVDNLFQLI